MMSADEGIDGVDPLADELVALLRERSLSIGVAESLTGGLLAGALVSVPGASAVFRGGIVAYATDLKTTLLGVDPGLLARHGPVHPEVAAEMARGVRRALAGELVAVDVGVSTTGVAGPQASDGAPVGTVFIGVSAGERTRVRRLDLTGSRDHIRRTTAVEALRFVMAELMGNESAGDHPDDVRLE